MMQRIDLDLLDGHPENANVMGAEALEKLAAHIGKSGQYPPLIVRAHPERVGRYQLLDGHHRAKALRQLGYRDAECVVWAVDDEQAMMLLLTLNRLHGEDDPRRRGALLKRLAESQELEALAAQLPDDLERMSRLIALVEPPPMPAEPREVDDMPHAVTFFLSGAQRRALFARLDAVGGERSAALMELVGLADA